MFSAEALAAFAIKCLAVAGAFLVGYVAFALLALALDRTFARNRTPEGFKQLFRQLGGLTAAALAAYILFASSGGTGLFGSGSGNPSGPSAPANPKTPTAPPPPAPPTPEPPPSPPDTSPLSPADVVLRLRVLGGPDVIEQRFYQFEGSDSALTFSDVQAAILTRKPAGPGKLYLEIAFPPRNAPPPDHPAVSQLEHWARTQGIQPLLVLK